MLTGGGGHLAGRDDACVGVGGMAVGPRVATLDAAHPPVVAVGPFVFLHVAREREEERG